MNNDLSKLKALLPSKSEMIARHTAVTIIFASYICFVACRTFYVIMFGASYSERLGSTILGAVHILATLFVMIFLSTKKHRGEDKNALKRSLAFLLIGFVISVSIMTCVVIKHPRGIEVYYSHILNIENNELQFIGIRPPNKEYEWKVPDCSLKTEVIPKHTYEITIIANKVVKLDCIDLYERVRYKL